MKIIASQEARSVARLPQEDITLPPSFSSRDFIDLVAMTYKFTSFPELTPQWVKQPTRTMTFDLGELVLEDRKITINRLDVYSDAAVVTAQTTEDGDVVLDSLLTLMKNAGYAIREKSIRRNYISAVIVEFDDGIEAYIQAVKSLEDVVSKVFRENLGVETPAQVMRIGFACDPSQLRGEDLRSVAELTIERRANYPFDANRYFSSAPLKTSIHFETLLLMERAMRGLSRK